MKKRSSVRGRLLASVGLIAIVTVVALTLVPSAFNSNTPNGLSAYVVVTTRGPLPACEEGACTDANIVRSFIHVINSNKIESVTGTFRSRETMLNSFVVTSVDCELSINGATPADCGTFIPPPNPTSDFDKGAAGHWPSSVTCPVDDSGFHCFTVGRPAVAPGENTIAYYIGWAHGVGEATGKHVFRWTLHGTLNGNPVDLTATSPQITMT